MSYNVLSKTIENPENFSGKRMLVKKNMTFLSKLDAFTVTLSLKHFDTEDQSLVSVLNL